MYTRIILQTVKSSKDGSRSNVVGCDSCFGGHVCGDLCFPHMALEQQIIDQMTLNTKVKEALEKKMGVSCETNPSDPQQLVCH